MTIWVKDESGIQIPTVSFFQVNRKNNQPIIQILAESVGNSLVMNTGQAIVRDQIICYSDQAYMRARSVFL